MDVTIQLSDEAARALQQHQSLPELGRLANQLGIVLEPLHPHSADRALMSFFRAELPDGADGERIVTRLLRSPYVMAAYIKPPEGPPGS